MSVSVRALVAGAVVAAVAIGALATLVLTGDDDEPVRAAVPTSTSTTIAAQPPTTRALPSTTTSAPAIAAPTSSAPPPPDPPPAQTLGDFPRYSNDDASGSGCSPGPGALPDGWWFGELPDGPSGPVMRFDLMCFFVGDAAVRAAAADGHPTALDEGFVENDYWIRNDNPTLRDVPVSAAVDVYCVLLDPSDASRPLPCSRLDLGGFAVWLRVNGSQVDRIVEQFVP